MTLSTRLIILFDQLLQCFAGAGEVPFGGAFIDTQHIGDFAVLIAVDDVQAEHAALGRASSGAGR